MSEIKKVKLLDGREIELKAFTTGQMTKALKMNNEIEQSKAMVMASSGMNEMEIDQLDFRDFIMIQEEMQSFLKR